MGVSILIIIFALVLTIVIESIVIIISGVTKPKVLKTAFYVNIITNVPLNIFLGLLRYAFHGGFAIYLIPVYELIIIFAEYQLFRMVYDGIIGRKTILKLVIAMNIISFTIGMIVDYIMW